MRTPLTACLLLIAVPGLAADPPDKQETPPPHALLKFERKGLKRWITTYELTTVSGATYELRIAYGDRGNMYELYTLNAMLAANWVAGPDRDASGIVVVAVTVVAVVIRRAQVRIRLGVVRRGEDQVVAEGGVRVAVVGVDQGAAVAVDEARLDALPQRVAGVLEEATACSLGRDADDVVGVERAE